ncbi:MAG: type II secretory pathway pseudopilin PulG [Pseudohongiellaceae bacterium]|jgi:type II secretory pathway pseudopilin PulG
MLRRTKPKKSLTHRQNKHLKAVAMKHSTRKIPNIGSRQIAAHQQSGVVLLLFVIGLFIVSSSLFLTALNNNQAKQDRDLNAAAALSAVKEQLIAFTILGSEHFGVTGAGPGHLFCPDTNGNGLANSPCGIDPLGRLPRSVTTLLGAQRFTEFGVGQDQEFWFALDNSLRSNPASVFNSSTVPTLTVDGVTGYVAVLLAPGEANSLQARPNNSAANYLEGGNAASATFVTSDALAPENFTDRLLGIRLAEIMPGVTARVAETIKATLDSYHGTSGSYPDDTSFDDPLLLDFATVMGPAGTAPGWFAANNWLNQVNPNYVRLNTDSATVVFNGCAITYTINQNFSGIERSTNQC